MRFVPLARFSGTARLTYRAWDQTVGAFGDTLSSTLAGTAFSTASETASITVNAVNDRPVLDTSGSPLLPPVLPGTTQPEGQSVAALVGSSISDLDPGASPGIAVTALVSANGTWEFSLDGGTNWQSFGATTTRTARLLGAQDFIRFVPDVGFTGVATLSFRAWDQTVGAAGDTADVTAAGATASSAATETLSALVNDAPVLIV